MNLLVQCNNIVITNAARRASGLAWIYKPWRVGCNPLVLYQYIMPFKDKEKRKKYAHHYSKKYYIKNKDVIKKRAASFRKLAVKRNSEFIKTYLSCSLCLDCGEKDIRVLEFDHVKGNKRNDVSTLVWTACSIQTIKKEIKKCEVVCANCHRIRTWERKQ